MPAGSVRMRFLCNLLIWFSVTLLALVYGLPSLACTAGTFLLPTTCIRSQLLSCDGIQTFSFLPEPLFYNLSEKNELGD